MVVISLSPFSGGEIYNIMFSKKYSTVFRKKEVHIHIIYVMLNKNTLLLFLCKTFVTVVEQIDILLLKKMLLLQKRFIINTKQFVSHEEELLIQNRSVTNAEQVVPLEKEICYFC